MGIYAYAVAGWLMVIGSFGIVRSRHLVHTVVSLSVAQAGTYVLLLAVGYQKAVPAPVYNPGTPLTVRVVDPVVQALTLTDVVVSATVSALLLALTVQIHARHQTVDPDELQSLHG